MVELQKKQAELEARGIRVIAISQEDKDLESASRFLSSFGERKFDIVADLNREKTAAIDRTTAYYVDEHGVVQQVFPMLIHHRPSWDALFGEIDRIDALKKVTEPEVGAPEDGE